MKITNEFIEENKDKRFTIVFDNGVILKNIKFFISTCNTVGYLRGREKRRGSVFPIYNKIKEIKEVNKKVHTDISNAKTILKKIHPNVWDDLKNEMNDVIKNNIIGQDFEWHFRGKLKIKTITKHLSLTERLQLKRAFENKERFSWRKYTYHRSGRDLSISTEIGEDGKFRAYFSSEYAGCGNGDYWLLLNPTTAIFYETD